MPTPAIESLSELLDDPHYADALRLAAHLPKDEQVSDTAAQVLGRRLTPRTFRVQVDEIIKLLRGPLLAPFLDMVAGLGLDAELYRERLTLSDGVDARLSDTHRRSLLAALYWAKSSERGRQQSVPADPRGREREDFARRLHLPVAILDAALVRGWRRRRAEDVGTDIETIVDSPLDHSPDEIMLMDEVWRTTTGADDGPVLFGVAGYTPIRAEAEGRIGTRLRLRPTNYREFKGSNDAFQAAAGIFAQRAWELGLGHREFYDYKDLARSRLANPLSVTCVAYLKGPGGLMGIQNRNFARVHSGRYCFQATAGGFTTVVGDSYRDDRPYAGAAPDPFKTIVREFSEEAFQLRPSAVGPPTSPIAEEDVTLLALVRDLASCWEVGLVGEIALPFDLDDIERGVVVVGSDYWFEGMSVGARGPIEWVEATPYGLAHWLRDDKRANIADFMPFGLAAILLSFYHRGFSIGEIRDALRPVAGPDQVHLRMVDDLEWGASSGNAGTIPSRPPRPDLLRRRLSCWGPDGA